MHSFRSLFSTSVAALLCALILYLMTPLAAADGIWVVARKDATATALTRIEVANLFLGIGSASVHLTPFDLKDIQLRERFYREVAGLSAASVRAHWAKQVFTGRGRPPAMLALEDVEQLLSKNPGAVTYVPADQLPAGSKILLIMESGEQK